MDLDCLNYLKAGAALSLVVGASYGISLLVRLAKYDSAEWEENRKRIDPNATLINRLTGWGYKPLQEGDTRVESRLYHTRDKKTGKEVFKLKYRLSNLALTQLENVLK